jgi:putative membrane protein insertion efficiency factor
MVIVVGRIPAAGDLGGPPGRLTWLRPAGSAVAVIHLYQRVAPPAIRGRCVFTPTCSDYMIRSIEKYGVIRGAARGFKRLLRCRPPNGGVDEP